eukprot:Rmarinus@m.20604
MNLPWKGFMRSLPRLCAHQKFPDLSARLCNNPAMEVELNADSRMTQDVVLLLEYPLLSRFLSSIMEVLCIPVPGRSHVSLRLRQTTRFLQMLNEVAQRRKLLGLLLKLKRRCRQWRRRVNLDICQTHPMMMD